MRPRNASWTARAVWAIAAAGLVAIAAALLVVTRKNPVHSAIFLVLFFTMISLDFLILRAPFLAVVQVLVYAGAIMVLFLFVVMLLNVPTEDAPTGYHTRLLGGAGPRRFGAVLVDDP